MSQVYVHMCIYQGGPYCETFNYYFGPFDVNQDLLSNEMDHFDGVGKFVFAGRAPNSCYVDKKTRLDLWNVRNNNHDKNVQFDVFTDPTNYKYAEKANECLLLHVLTTPYDGTKDLTLGQSLLPITHSIFMGEKL